MSNKPALSLHIHTENKELKDLNPIQYISATLKLLTMCMKPDFLNTLLTKPDDFSKYLKILINYRG